MRRFAFALVLGHTFSFATLAVAAPWGRWSMWRLCLPISIPSIPLVFPLILLAVGPSRGSTPRAFASATGLMHKGLISLCPPASTIGATLMSVLAKAPAPTASPGILLDCSHCDCCDAMQKRRVARMVCRQNLSDSLNTDGGELFVPFAEQMPVQTRSSSRSTLGTAMSIFRRIESQNWPRKKSGSERQ